MAFDGTLKFDTAIDQTGFQSGISGLGDLAKTGLTGLGDVAKASMAAVTSAVSAVSRAVLDIGTSAISVGKEFESGMSQVIATMGITKDTIQDGVNSYDLLRQAAQDAGASTTFSATEAAGALNYLALAGYDAATAAESLPAVLNLAAAGGLQLQYAADLATDAMAALGIEASNENLTHFGDQMAVTASKANTSVAQLGEAILTVGGTAKSLSGGVSEMNAALGVLANRGIKGAEGGTALRNMILSLTAPTDKAAAVLDNLGVKVLDDTGSMRALDDVFGDLNGALSDMSDGEKTQVLNDIFNKVDLKSAQAMLAGCGEEFDSLTAALDSCDGAMQQMAETMNDTLEGDMKSLQSKAEALGITVYESLNTPLRELTQLGIGYIGQLTAAFESGGFGGAAEAVGGILGDAVTTLGDYLPDVVGIGSRIVSSLLDGVAANSGSIIETGLDMGLNLLSGFGGITVNFLDLGANLMTGLADGIESRLPQISGTSREILLRIIKAVGDNLPVILTAGAGLIGAFGESILDSLPVLLDCAVQIMQALVDVIADPDDLTALVNAAALIVTTLGGALLDNLPVLLDAGAKVIGAVVAMFADPEALTELLDAGVSILTSLAGILLDNIPLLLQAAVTIVGTLGLYLAEHADDLIGGALTLVQTLVEMVTDNLPLLLEAAAAIVVALCDGIAEHSQDWLIAVEQIVQTIWDLFHDPEIVETLWQAAAEIAKALIPAATEAAGGLVMFVYDMCNFLGEAIAETDWGALGAAILEGILSGFAGQEVDLAEFFGNFGENWISGIKDVFGIHSPSKVMRDEVGRYLALGIGKGFEDNIPDAAEEAFDALTDLPDIPLAFETDDITVSLAEEAADILASIRNAKLSASVDPAALDLMLSAPPVRTDSLVQPSPTASITNNYTTNSTTNTTDSPARSAPSGDIIIPVQIGNEKIEQFVLDAIQIENMRSGGVSV